MAVKILKETLYDWLIDDILEEKHTEDLISSHIDKAALITPHTERQSGKTTGDT